MSASAWVCMVDALALALSILNWASVRPAASNACLRYGASYCTYRVEVVVSGSSTPMRPLPEEARPLSSAMSEKSAVKAEASSCGTAAVVDAGGADDAPPPPPLPPDELHPATTRPSAAIAPMIRIERIGDIVVLLWSGIHLPVPAVLTPSAPFCKPVV